MRKKIFTVLLSFVLVLVFAGTVMALPTGERISGADRYETANNVALSGWDSTEYVIIVDGLKYPDALACVTLAKQYNAPVLLAKNGEIEDSTMSTIEELGASKVIIVGGTAVIPNTTVSNLKENGLTVTRIAGKNRYDTALKVAESLPNVSNEVVVVCGDDFVDALSVSSIAAYNDMPIILVPSGSVPNDTMNYINSGKFEKTWVVGFYDRITFKDELKMNNAVRVNTGNNRYDQNLQVNYRFGDMANYDKVYITTGVSYADALAGSALAAQNGNPIFFIDSYTPSGTLDKMKSKMINSRELVILGGKSATPSKVVNELISNSEESNLAPNADLKSNGETVEDLIKPGTLTKDDMDPKLYWWATTIKGTVNGDITIEETPEQLYDEVIALVKIGSEYQDIITPDDLEEYLNKKFPTFNTPTGPFKTEFRVYYNGFQRHYGNLYYFPTLTINTRYSGWMQESFFNDPSTVAKFQDFQKQIHDVARGAFPSNKLYIEGCFYDLVWVNTAMTFCNWDTGNWDNDHSRWTEACHGEVLTTQPKFQFRPDRDYLYFTPKDKPTNYDF
ncbi:MAG: cell wall-binding repeat-containing protein [Ruminococcaceae bacterium]|nr:cell wall-binding repeat-containing protein [Oscillospiraceae bacterium]